MPKTFEYKSRFYLIVQKILAFASSTNLVRNVRNVSPDFKQTAWVLLYK